MAYAKYINEYIETCKRNEPIYTEDIATRIADVFELSIVEAKKVVNVHLKRLADRGVLVRMRKGVYGKVMTGVFGVANPNPTEMAYQMFMRHGDDIIGYETGPTLLNAIGLSSLLPKDYHIATNRYRYRVKEKAFVVATKPIETVTNDNVRYLQIVEAIKAISKYGYDADDPMVLLRKFMRGNNIDSTVLLRRAHMHCNDKELRKIVELTIGDETNEVA